MSNSAISFNTAGLASTTSPGLVGTGAQTFAGDKTFNGLVSANGGAITTGLTGANTATVYTSGSGKIGELRSAVRANADVASEVYSELSLSLGTGVWLVTGHVNWTRNGATVTNNNYLVQIGMPSVGSNYAIFAAGCWSNTWTFAALPTPTVLVRCDGTNMVVPGCTTQATTSIAMRFYQGGFTGGPIKAEGYVQAVRIA